MINTISFIKLTNYCYRLKIPFDDIYTSVFLLTTEKGNVFVDCGTIPTDVTEYILPSLKEAQKRTQQQVMIERALFELPAAGYTISKRLSEISR